MAEWVTATVHIMIDQERRAKPEARADVISKVFPSDLHQSTGLHHLQVPQPPKRSNQLGTKCPKCETVGDISIPNYQVYEQHLLFFEIIAISLSDPFLMSSPSPSPPSFISLEVSLSCPFHFSVS